MAIVKMNKLSLIGLQTDRDGIMKELMKMGVVEITNLEQKLDDKEWSELVNMDGDTEGVSFIEQRIEKVTSAISYLARFESRKKGLFEPKRAITYKEYNQAVNRNEEIWNTIEQINRYDERLSVLRSEENRLDNLIATLRPWESLTVPVDMNSTKSCLILLGVVPEIANIEELKQELLEQVGESYLEMVSSDKDQSYLLVVFYASLENEVMRVLKKYGFNKVTFKEFSGTVKENIEHAEQRIRGIKKEREEIGKKIAQLATEKDQLEIMYDNLVMQRDQKRILESIGKTDKIFILEGWLPAKDSEQVRKEIIKKWDCIVTIREPDKDEDFPVLLENSSLVEPFEVVTEMYGLPKSTTFDPNLVMGLFFFLFFGLMVGDAGYGLLMTIVTGIILLKFKLEGQTYKMIKLLFFGGISTFIWGALFGGWFGDIVQVLSGNSELNLALWFNPMDDPMRLLIWSFILGIVHLYAGMGMQAYKIIRKGKVIDAIFDVGLWYIFLTGLILLGVGGTFATTGKYMAIAGVVSLIFTQGRSEKNIFKKLLTGILSLYNVTGFMSDVLSYSRLLALGLSTGVIASVINTIGALLGFNILGIIVLIIVFSGGHVFNILINVLGAFVHTSRLQYVEFFGKFYESGGKAYRPFKINTKYITIKDGEAV